MSDFDFFNIDRTQLDEEWSRFPNEMFELGERLADAKQALEEAKSGLDVREAELAKKIRENPSKFGLDKTTVEAVKQETAILLAKSKAWKQYLKAKHSVDIHNAAVDAMHGKKAALQDMVYLWGMQYSADLKVKGDTSSRQRVENMTDKAVFSKSIQKKGKRTTK